VDSEDETEVLPAHYILKLIVFQFRVCSLEYFFDEMTFWEINDLVSYIGYLDRNFMEMSRLQIFTEAQVHSRKELELTKILSFPWDQEH